jgi:hypothetical protein
LLTGCCLFTTKKFIFAVGEEMCSERECSGVRERVDGLCQRGGYV